jgi:hypothetical protein
MDAKVFSDLLARNQPIRIDTASGRSYEVAHPDFIAISPSRTTIFLFHQENGEDHMAFLALSGITGAVVKTKPEDLTSDLT